MHFPRRSQAADPASSRTPALPPARARGPARSAHAQCRPRPGPTGTPAGGVPASPPAPWPRMRGAPPPPDGRRGRVSGFRPVPSRPGRRFPLPAPPVPHARRAAAAAAAAASGALQARLEAKGETGSATLAGPPGALASAARPATYTLPRLPPPPVPPLRGRAAPAIAPRLHGQDNMAPAGAHPEVKGVTALTLTGRTRAPVAAIFAEGARAALPAALGRAAAIFAAGSPAAGSPRESGAGTRSFRAAPGAWRDSPSHGRFLSALLHRLPLTGV